MEKEFDSVVMVRPGSSIYEYLDELKAYCWLALRVDPDHFTVNEAILFCRQNREERHNFEPPEKSTTPHKKIVFFDYQQTTLKDVQRLRFECPQNGCIVEGYGSENSKTDIFEDCLKKFKDEIDEVRALVDKLGNDFPMPADLFR